MAFKHNPTNKWIAATIVVGRIIFTIVAIFFVWSSAPTGKQDGESDAGYELRAAWQTISHIAILAGIAWLCRHLVNGKRIEENKILDASVVVE